MVVRGIVNTVYELRVCSVRVTLYKEENMNTWSDLPSVRCGVCVMCTGTMLAEYKLFILSFPVFFINLV